MFMIREEDILSPNLEHKKSYYLNNRIESDHRRIKRLTRLILGFKSFLSANL